LGLGQAGALCILLAIAGGTPAAALTGEQQARICIEKGGDPPKCKAAVPACKKTGVFASPGGKRWPPTAIQVSLSAESPRCLPNEVSRQAPGVSVTFGCHG